MKIRLLFTGKTDEAYLTEGIEKYAKRVRAFANFEIITIAVQKKWSALPPEQRMEKEGQLLLDWISKHDHCVLLDERGRKLTSVSFARFMEERMNRSVKSLLFIVGGPYGFSDKVRNALPVQLSLSPMTFSHQVIRLIFMEQLYRAFTIIHNQPYHNA